MKKIQSTLLAISLIASLFFSTAYAATSTTDNNPHKMRDLVDAYRGEKFAEQGSGMMCYQPNRTTNAGPHKMRDSLKAYQIKRSEGMADTQIDNKRIHRGIMMKRNGAPWRLLAELTGKDVDTIQQYCHLNNKTPYAYAKENGVEVQFQERQLTTVKDRLNWAVANNRASQEKADAALAGFLEYQKDQAAGKEMHPQELAPKMMDNSQNNMIQEEVEE